MGTAPSVNSRIYRSGECQVEQLNEEESSERSYPQWINLELIQGAADFEALTY